MVVFNIITIGLNKYIIIRNIFDYALTSFKVVLVLSIILKTIGYYTKYTFIKKCILKIVKHSMYYFLKI